MAAANDRLVSVVSVEMQPAPRKDKRENVASGGYPLAVLAANSDCEVYFIRHLGLSFTGRCGNLLCPTLISKPKPGPSRTGGKPTAWQARSTRVLSRNKP